MTWRRPTGGRSQFFAAALSASQAPRGRNPAHPDPSGPSACPSAAPRTMASKKWSAMQASSTAKPSCSQETLRTLDTDGQATMGTAGPRPGAAPQPAATSAAPLLWHPARCAPESAPARRRGVAARAEAAGAGCRTRTAAGAAAASRVSASRMTLRALAGLRPSCAAARALPNEKGGAQTWMLQLVDAAPSPPSLRTSRTTETVGSACAIARSRRLDNSGGSAQSSAEQAGMSFLASGKSVGS